MPNLDSNHDIVPMRGPDPSPTTDLGESIECMSNILWFASGEFVLKHHPNSGTVVLLRSAWSTFWIYLAALLMQELVDPTRDWSTGYFVNTLKVRQSVHATIPWIGAIFAGTYAALYARFSSQWLYLSGVYNSIMQEQVESAFGHYNNKKALINWKAGFVEDAEELHLAMKPFFAMVVVGMLEDKYVADAYVKNTTGGEHRLAVLKAGLTAVLTSENRRRTRRSS